MTIKEIYTLANELTEQEINNILAGWERDQDTEEIETFNTLVRLGDSRALACATTIAKRYNSVDNYETNYRAYYL